MIYKAFALRLIDYCVAALTIVIGPLLVFLSHAIRYLPMTQRILDKIGIGILRHHYYSPIMFPEDVRDALDRPRLLPALDLNVEGQLSFVRMLNYVDELLSIPRIKSRVSEYGYKNGSFESGDAEMFYNIIRYFKPRRIVEIGCGQSTLIATLAEKKNRQEDKSYFCQHICVEPYEQPWLETIGIEIIRKPIEVLESDVIQSLQENDILFIDSSHTIRPQGDVLHEYLYLLPLIRPGVIVHAHDIFTPRDYPETWVVQERRLWDEQYLLEAFLSFNKSFEVLAAMNFLYHEHRSELKLACPVLIHEIDNEPGSFWFRRLS